jgi:hypothetical protein
VAYRSNAVVALDRDDRLAVKRGDGYLVKINSGGIKRLVNGFFEGPANAKKPGEIFGEGCPFGSVENLANKSISFVLEPRNQCQVTAMVNPHAFLIKMLKQARFQVSSQSLRLFFLRQGIYFCKSLKVQGSLSGQNRRIKSLFALRTWSRRVYGLERTRTPAD